jgi:predicted GH43/DUF377 family glycosyl hydrolase
MEALLARATNPLAAVDRLGVVMQPDPADPSEVEGVLNPGLIRGRDGALYLFARVVAAGNYSRIRMARVIFDEAVRPMAVERLGVALEPAAEYECRGSGAGGCEDPRITFLPELDLYVMTYTGLGPRGARVAISISSNLFRWERLGLLDLGYQDGVDFDQFENKDAFYFPEPVLAPDGSYAFACMHRPMTGADHAGSRRALSHLRPSIWVSYVPVRDALADIKQLLRPRQHRLVLEPAYRWERVKVGGGTPPILTNQGWLLFHHGIERVVTRGRKGHLRYAAGAFLVDRYDVTRVIWRSRHPLLCPATDEEVFGVVNHVVFPTGVDMVDTRTVDLYYGMADARVGVARVILQPEACSPARAAS